MASWASARIERAGALTLKTDSHPPVTSPGTPPINRTVKHLAVAVTLSLAVHGLPLVGALKFPFAVHDDQAIRTRVVEVGFERAQPARAPQVAPTPTPPTPPTPAAPPSTPAANQQQNPTPPRPPRRNVVVPNSVPDLRLRPPSITPVHPTRIVPQQALSLRPSVPSFANTVGPLSAMIPQGALITLALRTDRIRTTPHARLVRRVFAGIRDWREMLGGSSLDVVDDVDQLVLAAANPFGANNEAADWFVLAKPAAGSERSLYRAIQAMVASEHPQRARSQRHSSHSHDAGGPENSAANSLSDDGGLGSVDDGSVAENVPAHEHTNEVAQDGSDADASESSVPDEPSAWTVQNGAQITQLNRYGAVRDYVVFPDGTAAIAMPSQLDALLTAMAQRSESPENGNPSILLLGQAEGIRNVIVEVPTMHGPFPLPSRAELTLATVTTDGGDIELTAKMQYDDAAAARSARDEWVYCRTRWHAMIQSIPGLGTVNALSGMFGVRTWTSDVPTAESALDVLEFRTQRNSVIVHGRLSAEQVRAILNVAVGASGLAR